MASITTRAGKGSPLTNAELDANFNNINAELATAVITGGTINGATIGATTATTGKFSQLDADNLRLDGNTISSTDTNGNVTITPNGTGEVTISKLNVTGVATLAAGAILGTPASGVVTNLTGTASININGTVGATTATTGNFTTLTATADSAFTSTGALTISKGTVLQRPGAPAAGMLRFNDDSDEFEGYNGTAWASVGGAALVNDTSTSTNVFPLFASATTGTAATLNTSDAKLLYKPSTGEFQATALVASNGIVVNSKTVSSSYTLAATNNAMSAGPITIDSGVTVTISSGARYVVI
jgi:hypothetical protein